MSADVSAGASVVAGTRRELILYATPTGPLAEQCAAYFDAASQTLGPTTAQTYPPHCTLTGFFRRTDAGVARAVAEIAPVIAAAGPVPGDAVTVVGCHATAEWVGLELRSPWLSDLAASVADGHTLAPGDDALRLKDWLHLSLAYGTAIDRPAADRSSIALLLDRYGALAEVMIDPNAAVGWEVGLWERTDQGWVRHQPGVSPG